MSPRLAKKMASLMRSHRFTFPEPIPASHTFFLSELDSKDGFIHLSTARQVPKTLERFFANVESVTLLRIELDRLAAFKRVKWEGSDNDSESRPAHIWMLPIRFSIEGVFLPKHKVVDPW